VFILLFGCGFVASALVSVAGQMLNYAPIMIGGISIISLVGWVLPFGYGGRAWFKGPQRTLRRRGLWGRGLRVRMFRRCRDKNEAE
jgi:hypothetical protein